jgi:trimethylamine---corrinoid protein Co-methyltransferase
VSKRHLDMVYSHIRYSDKPFMGSVTAPERAEDSVAMAKMVFGDDFVDNNCVLINLINANSPLVFDSTMIGALKVYARAGQATVISPFILSGAMSPVTVIGTLTQILAEAWRAWPSPSCAGRALRWCSAPSPARSRCSRARPTFGTPEPAYVLAGAAQLARRLNVPFRSGGSLCASKLPDAQAAHESANTLWPTLLSGVNFVLHSAGWLEGGLVSGYEKFIIDADQLTMFQRFTQGTDLSPDAQALDAIREVGPGSHFLGCAHTQANFEDAFWRSSVADNNSFEQWRDAGGLDTAQRANAIWKQQLADYEAPPLDTGLDEALTDFMARRKEVLPDSVS